MPNFVPKHACMEKQYLPLFPLSSVVFPGEKLNLHIFEPRYQQLINDCMTTSTTFGVPPFIGNEVCDFATEVAVMHVQRRYEDGRMDISTKGVQVVEVASFQNPAENKMYAAGYVQPYMGSNLESSSVRVELLSLAEELFKLLGLSPSNMNMQASILSWELGHKVGLSLEQEYNLLTIKHEAERQLYLVEHLRTAIPLVDEMEKTKARIRMNGHFKHFDALDF